MAEKHNYPISTVEELNLLVDRNKNNKWPDLELKKRAFAHEYITNGYKHREAADKVGFAKSSGISLLRDPLLAAYIEHLQSMQMTNNIITKDFINQQYLYLYDMATGQEPIHHVTSEGDEVMVRKTELGTAHNILDKMSKSTEYAKDTQNKTAPVSVSINFGRLFGDEERDDGSITIEGTIDE